MSDEKRVDGVGAVSGRPERAEVVVELRHSLARVGLQELGTHGVEVLRPLLYIGVLRLRRAGEGEGFKAGGRGVTRSVLEWSEPKRPYQGSSHF